MDILYLEGPNTLPTICRGCSGCIGASTSDGLEVLVHDGERDWLLIDGLENQNIWFKKNNDKNSKYIYTYNLKAEISNVRYASECLSRSLENGNGALAFDDVV